MISFNYLKFVTTALDISSYDGAAQHQWRGKYGGTVTV